MNSRDESNIPKELSDLEARLARRATPETDGGFRTRVLNAVTHELRPAWREPRWWIAAAACLAVAASVLLRPTHPPPADDSAKRPAVVRPADSLADPAPTFMAYRKALQQSPQQLDKLLTYHGYALLRRSDDEQDMKPQW
jgi:hypothetical protein